MFDTSFAGMAYCRSVRWRAIYQEVRYNNKIELFGVYTGEIKFDLNLNKSLQYMVIGF